MIKFSGRRLARIERSVEPGLYLNEPGGPRAVPRQRRLGDVWGDRARRKWHPLWWGHPPYEFCPCPAAEGLRIHDRVKYGQVRP